MAIELKRPQSVLAAVKEKGVLSGKRIERSETGEPGEFEGMNEQELAKYIGQKMAELGIEIATMRCDLLFAQPTWRPSSQQKGAHDFGGA